MNKLWLVSAAYGAPGNSCVQSGTTMAEDGANAAASVVSEYYLRNRGTPSAMLPILGVHVMEIPRENIELALKALDAQPPGPQGASVLSLVPSQPVGTPGAIPQHQMLDPGAGPA